MTGTQSKQIESNNLKVIQDTIVLEALLNKKCSQYSSICSDPQLKAVFDEGCQMHKQNFNSLKAYLDSHQ
ncbi:hypothetical protein BJV85_001207 [Clostridium acetobutylicum]|uniref:Spore coat protein n=1 Tax=Clostridium acetobutylicum (strain ATCC 824 / DSM 792 / JCM 1419 / IAM 19013 / LMG 5710 / NBRC 13948 / NRRL B-527 / VKM B-1787 / 2291 / W) TaxID=272562 RepID=Q97FP6_CLOAB|nr:MULTISPECIES: hypothetical protein [Clostridium]AAK80629.1 Hypothetical protein CA_C2682 [Clostridium acetobutylicum ATCC 824]ADZ21728.1 Conserved hypothetical protein [Clostridium acetobutylicum EA 2018]AEI32499.1 hypothetical protein SMB_G2717 [Clostridium acetobutylicum DSM 1731]AWV78954.1 hypothetical protein DK921_02275 [Clostridium acetobutylicum]KHD37005.1 hypothetical protein NL50_06645 [Clostridium acetobutylicum]